MPSTTHEALIELFRNRPTLAAELLATSLGVTVPCFERARLDSGDLTDLAPTEYRADAVVVLTRRCSRWSSRCSSPATSGSAGAGRCT